MATRARRGQALVEMALGMFAFALVASALVGFAIYIASALDMRRTMRADAGERAMGSIGQPTSLVTSQDSRKVEVDPIAAEYVFGREEVSVRDSVSLPPMSGSL